MHSVKLFIFSILGCLLLRPAVSQEIETNSGHERNFAFEVKHIDEFFERFNNEKDAFIVKYVKANYPGVTVDRKTLIDNLFNRYKILRESLTDDFTRQVTNRASPVYLDFDSEWYAEAIGKFEYNHKRIDVTIILKIEQDENGGSKWMIVGARSENIAPARGTVSVPGKISPIKFLNPMSHATNFMSLSVALNDKPNIRDYLDDGFFQSPGSVVFLNAILKNQLKFLYVKSIKYHFLQVDGWIFTVDQVRRQSINSGWLISMLLKVSTREKQLYRRSLLQINE